MSILIPLMLILAGISYLTYQIHQKKQEKPVIQASKTQIITKHCSDCGKEFQVKRIPLPKPFFFNWKDQICFALFGKKVWVNYRRGDLRAKFIVHYLEPTIWLAIFCLVNVMSKLLSHLLFAWPLNWFFWFALAALPLLGIVIFCQWKRLKQIPANLRRKHEI